MELTKGKKRKIKQWANAFYKAHEQIQSKEDDYCKVCDRGGNLKWIDNKEVINQLMDELFVILFKTSNSASQSSDEESLISSYEARVKSIRSNGKCIGKRYG